MPVDLVVVRSSVRVELLEAEGSTAILSRSRPEPRHMSEKAPVRLLATFRCQEAAHARAPAPGKGVRGAC